MTKKEKKKKSISLLLDNELYDAIILYCKDKRVNKSSFIRGLISDKLLKENYIKKEANKYEFF